MKSYHCNMCKYTTNNRQNYNSHLLSKIHNINSNIEDRHYTCEFCNKTFGHRSSLSRHIKHNCKKREREKDPSIETNIIKNLESVISQQEATIQNLRIKY